MQFCNRLDMHGVWKCSRIQISGTCITLHHGGAADSKPAADSENIFLNSGFRVIKYRFVVRSETSGGGLSSDRFQIDTNADYQ